MEEKEHRFLEQRMYEVDQELENHLLQLDDEYPPPAPPPKGATWPVVRYQLEKALLQRLLADTADTPLEYKLESRISQLQRDEIEALKDTFATREYSDRFWSDEIYKQLLDELLQRWWDWKIN